jgi:hypothetical protein
MADSVQGSNQYARRRAARTGSGRLVPPPVPLAAQASPDLNSRPPGTQEINLEAVLAQVQAAASKQTSPAQLAQMAADRVPWVRLAVAGNPNTPREILERLSRDTLPAVRRRVATNPRCPDGTRVRLGRDPATALRDSPASEQQHTLN